MPDLFFEILGAEIPRGSAAPSIALQLAISNRVPGEQTQTIVLRVQVQIEAPRRRYSPDEQTALHDLFGEPERWSQTLRPLTWTNLAISVPAFTERTDVVLPLPCTFDFNLHASQYFHGVGQGTVPLTLLFSGTVFYKAADGRLQAAPISWNSQARFEFPVELWKHCLEIYHPNTMYLPLRRDSFERLCEYKRRHRLATFDQAIEEAIG